MPFTSTAATSTCHPGPPKSRKSEKVNVAFWTGESGGATIKETAMRICKSKGIPYAEQAYISLTLPHLYDPDHLTAMEKLIREHELEVLIIDPLYLCLLDQANSGGASNLFTMGSALSPIAEICNRTGCTIGLIHHFRKTGGDDKENPCDLSELSQAGCAEFARQWIMLQRMGKYKSDGRHELYMRAGGSFGHSGLYGVYVEEGLLKEGRKWDVEIKSDKEMYAIQREIADSKQLNQRHDWECKILATIDKYPGGLSLNKLRAATNIAKKNLEAILESFTIEGVLEHVETVVAHNPCWVWKRPGGSGRS
jgi:RecA-family ATPase